MADIEKGVYPGRDKSGRTGYDGRVQRKQHVTAKEENMQTTVIEYFEKYALAKYADNIALVDEGDTKGTYTFREWGFFASCCAGAILNKTLDYNRPMAVYLPKSARTLIADIGILYTGNCYTNLDTALPLQRTKSILTNLQPALVFTTKDFVDSLHAVGVNDDLIVLIDEVIAMSEPAEQVLLQKRLASVIDTDPICIINTSGSTGTPKSAVLNHRGIIDFVDWFADTFVMDEHDVIGSLSPFFFDGYIVGLFMSIIRGARIDIIPTDLAMFPVKLTEYMERKGISFIFWVPTIMVNIANTDAFNGLDLSCLKTICFAGEVFPSKHLNYWRQRIPNATFVNLYGPIEISVICTYFVVDREFSDDELIPIGFPCRNTKLLVLNDNDKPADIHEQGELCVRGSSLAHGYWNDPEKTQRAFVQNPLNPHYPEMIYRTGDLVFRNERDELIFVGRKDFQVKHFGYRIELSEIEGAVLAMDEIANACVIYDKLLKQIVLCYESHNEVKAAVIRKKLLETLPKYMLPNVFNHLIQFPRNPNGKIDRQKLMTDFCRG